MLVGTATADFAMSNVGFLGFYPESCRSVFGPNRMLNEWQLLTDAPNLTNDFNVVVSGQFAFNA